MQTLKDAARLFWRAIRRWRHDHVERFAAALAYYSMFSLAPLLMLGVAVSNRFASRKQTAEFVGDLAQATVGEVGQRLVEPILKLAPDPSADITATLFAFFTLLYGASSLFSHLQEALDSIFGGTPRAERWYVAFLRRRLIASLVCSAFVVLLVAGPTFGTAAVRLGHFPYAHLPLSLAVETLSFALIFRLLPGIKLPWNTILPGAAITAALFTGGQSLLALYLALIATKTVYGAASSLVALLVWVYASAHLLLFGAEVIQAWRDIERETALNA